MFSFVTSKRWTKESSLSSSEIDLKNEFQRYKKSEKLRYEISIWVRNGKFI